MHRAAFSSHQRPAISTLPKHLDQVDSVDNHRGEYEQAKQAGQRRQGEKVAHPGLATSAPLPLQPGSPTPSDHLIALR